MAVVQRKKKDPSLKLSKYPQYIIDLNKPDNYLKFFKEAKWANYTDQYIKDALIKDFNLPEDKIESVFIRGSAAIETYLRAMWDNFYTNNPQFKVA